MNFQVKVEYQTCAQHIHHIYSSPSGDVDQDVTVLAGAAPAASGSALSAFFESGTNFPENVYYLTANQHVRHIYLSPSGDFDQDLTTLTGAAPALAGSALSAFFESSTNFSEDVYYFPLAPCVGNYRLLLT